MKKLGKIKRFLFICLGALATGWLVMFAFIPHRLFDDPYSTLLYSREGELLSARIAGDGQWRFPESDSLPEKFVRCLVEYEDRYFYRHPGINPLSIARAVRQNIRAGETVSGGSTLTMQLARIARKNRPRTVVQKLIEGLWAVHLETTCSKRKILRLYASHAPFGGNVVGLEAASWRWFGRSPFELSWAESAMLAVLPNAPAMIHPGRNRDALLAKRNRLLGVLFERGFIDEMEYGLSCEEPLPAKPLPLPDAAPHFLERSPGASTLSRSLQRQVQGVVNRAAGRYESNLVWNVAAVVVDVSTGEALAYAGNVTARPKSSHGESVDAVVAERSTGSLLKPFLYAGMLDDGLILPHTLVSDTPLNINGFTPSNYDREFHGVVPASEALARSLNVPLVRMLSLYNTGRFMSLLRHLGMTTLRFSEDHYGASIILGGAEGTLWDMAQMYASCARVLNGGIGKRDVPLSSGAIWSTFEAMSALNRPEEEADWQQFSSMKRVAWKTGTSYGSRDAWAVGVTPRYVVGVWVGNASGEGRAGLTGVGYAAPVMFDIFSLLPSGEWFGTPYGELEEMVVCRRSGHKATPLCDLRDTLWVPRAGVETIPCPYHRRVHLSTDGRWRVDSSCERVENIVTRSWFVLSPAQEYYFRSHHPDYAVLPPVRPGCGEQTESIEVIYPEHGSAVFLPRGLSGEREQVVFSAAHSDPGATLYWYLDGRYAGLTSDTHRMAFSPPEGPHMLTLTDGAGNRRMVAFTVKR